MAKASKSGGKSERKEVFFRILVIVISGIILSIWSYLTYILVFVNWLIALFAGHRNKELAEFIEYWNSEMYLFARYLSGVSNERPFPFNDLRRISRFEE